MNRPYRFAKLVAGTKQSLFPSGQQETAVPTSYGVFYMVLPSASGRRQENTSGVRANKFRKSPAMSELPLFCHGARTAALVAQAAQIVAKIDRQNTVRCIQTLLLVFLTLQAGPSATPPPVAQKRSAGGAVLRQAPPRSRAQSRRDCA